MKINFLKFKIFFSSTFLPLSRQPNTSPHCARWPKPKKAPPRTHLKHNHTQIANSSKTKIQIYTSTTKNVNKNPQSCFFFFCFFFFFFYTFIDRCRLFCFLFLYFFSNQTWKTKQKSKWELRKFTMVSWKWVKEVEWGRFGRGGIWCFWWWNWGLLRWLFGRAGLVILCTQPITSFRLGFLQCFFSSLDGGLASLPMILYPSPLL